MKLLELRKQHKKTQQEIADILGIKHTSYLSYEKGINEPNIEKLTALANYYNVSIDYLVGREWNNDIGYLTPQQKECVNEIKQLNENNLTKVLGYVSALISTQG